MMEGALEVAQKLQNGFVVMVGAVLGHLIEVMHFGAAWSWKAFVSGALAGLVVGLLANDLLPTGALDHKFGILLIMGTMAFPLYRRAQKWIKAKANESMPVDGAD